MTTNSYFKILFLSAFALTLSGCFNWAARAVEKLPEKSTLNRTYDYEGKVVIIGAGSAGLAAANVLEKNNISYMVLEATDRFGGRLKKDTTLADFPIDMGAEWIHSNPAVLDLLRTPDRDQDELISYHLDESVVWDGQQLKPLSKSFMKAYYNFMPESKFKRSTWYDFLDQNIAQTVKHNIIYDAAVTSIDYSNEKVVIRDRNGVSYECDKVLVTVPMGVLQSEMIVFNPAMDAKKMEAIQSIGFPKGFKIALKFSEKFYPDVINLKGIAGENVYYDIAFKKEADSHILGYLCLGEQAKIYDALGSEKAIINKLLEQLDTMYDGKASELYTGEYRFENWGKHEYSQGTWTQAYQEKKSTLKTLAEPLDSKVYFAGEIFDPYQQMGVPGAILSGFHSMDKMLGEIEGARKKF